VVWAHKRDKLEGPGLHSQISSKSYMPCSVALFAVLPLAIRLLPGMYKVAQPDSATIPKPGSIVRKGAQGVKLSLPCAAVKMYGNRLKICYLYGRFIHGLISLHLPIVSTKKR